MKKPLKNYAFIDSQNVNLQVRAAGWRLDWRRFRVFLEEKYGVGVAYLFLGFVSENQNLYRSLQRAGFVLIFKEVSWREDGKPKGNVDAERRRLGSPSSKTFGIGSNTPPENEKAPSRDETLASAFSSGFC